MNIGIIGLGLIGGSLGLSLKKNGWNGEISRYDLNKANLNKALSLGLIDNKRDNLDTYKIEWSESGYVRVKLDDLTEWKYKKCADARLATGIAEGMLEKEKAIAIRKAEIIRRLKQKEFEETYCGT